MLNSRRCRRRPPAGRRVTGPRILASAVAAALAVVGDPALGEPAGARSEASIAATPAGAAAGREAGSSAEPPGGAAGEPVVATIAAAGLELTLPPGTMVGRRETATGTAVTAIDGGSPPTWSLLVQEITAGVDPPLPRRQLEQLLEPRRLVGDGIDVVEERRVEVDGRLGHVIRLLEGEDRPDRHVGLALVLRDADERSMVLFSIRARDEGTLERMLDAILSGTRLRAPDEISDERGDRLAAGGELLERMDEARLRSLVGTRQWYRTYRADPESGEEVEIGCMRVEVLEGLRGLVDPGREPRAYSMAEREPGLVVRVTGQFPVREGVVRTSQATHWMAWDQSEEQWSVRATVTDGRRTDSEALTGVRAPRTAASPRGSITVVTARERGRGATEPPAIWPVPEAMLSQPLRWLLGELMVLTEAEQRTYAWYAIDASDGRPDLTYREDRWRAAADGDGFVLESRPRPTTAPTLSRHDAEGRLVLRVTPEGIRTAPIELEALHRLWRSKGLPTGPLTAEEPTRRRR